MWNHSKKWLIDSSVALFFLVIPSILFFTDSITIKIDSNVVLFFCAYCIFIISAYFSRFINTGLYAVFDIITHNVKMDIITVAIVEKHTFFWNAYYKQNTRHFHGYYLIYCNQKNNDKTSRFFSDIPVNFEEKEIKIQYLGTSKIVILIESEIGMGRKGTSGVC